MLVPNQKGVIHEMRNLLKIVAAAILLVSFTFASGHSASADTPSKIMWGKTELKIGQIGKVTVLQDTPLVQIATDGTLTTIRTLRKGDEYRVYSYKSQNNGLFGVGAGSFVQKNANIKYETPSKRKLEIIAFKKLFQEANAIQNSTTTGYYTKQDMMALFNSHFTDWFTVHFISHSMMKKVIDGVTHYYFMQGTDSINTNTFVMDIFSWNERTTIEHYQVPTVDKDNKKGTADLVKISEYLDDNGNKKPPTYTVILEKKDDGRYVIYDVKHQ